MIMVLILLVVEKLGYSHFLSTLEDLHFSLQDILNFDNDLESPKFYGFFAANES